MPISLSDLFWILLIIAFLIPSLRHQYLEYKRLQLIKKLGEDRGSRVISLVQRQETFAFLGIPISRFIDIEDSESILRAIRQTPQDKPIDMIIHTPGGMVLAVEQIANALVNHPAKITVFVPHHAMSGGTLLALAADEIRMDPNAILGPLDPQIGEYPATSILVAVSEKPKRHIKDHTLILADISKKAQKQVYDSIEHILKANNMEQQKAQSIARILTSGNWTHDYPITFQHAKDLGFPVQLEIPQIIYDLMELYPQPRREQASVQYVPLPTPPDHPMVPPEK